MAFQGHLALLSQILGSNWAFEWNPSHLRYLGSKLRPVPSSLALVDFNQNCSVAVAEMPALGAWCGWAQFGAHVCSGSNQWAGIVSCCLTSPFLPSRDHIVLTSEAPCNWTASLPFWHCFLFTKEPVYCRLLQSFLQFACFAFSSFRSNIWQHSPDETWFWVSVVWYKWVSYGRRARISVKCRNRLLIQVYKWRLCAWTTSVPKG